MLISEIEGLDMAPEFPELVGKRVLVTGVRGSLGLEIARAFSDARTRLVLQTSGDDRETGALARLATERALDTRLISAPLTDTGEILEFARAAIQSFGGIDAVINLAHVGEPPAGADDAAIERLVSDALSVACLVTKVALNRMRTTLTEGAILNIVVEEKGASKRAQAIAGIARAALAGLTRCEAQEAAAAGIRINAIAPAASFADRGSRVSGDPDVATLALHLTSPRAHQLSGLVFEACFA